MIVNSARYMGVYNIDLIMSWTPKQYLLLLKGAQHRVIDDYEKIAKSAMANRYATNAKRAKETSIYNADKARKALERGFKGNIANFEKERLTSLRNGLKGFTLKFTSKGGK